MIGFPTLLIDVAIVPYLASVPIVASEDNSCTARQFSFPSSEPAQAQVWPTVKQY